VSNTLSQDRLAITLLIDRFIANAVPGSVLEDARKNCRLVIDMSVPSGWQNSVINFDYRGYASLDPGAIGTQRSLYDVQGDSQNTAIEHQMVGPPS
jgi:hypothetical protein